MDRGNKRLKAELRETAIDLYRAGMITVDELMAYNVMRGEELPDGPQGCGVPLAQAGQPLNAAGLSGGEAIRLTPEASL